MTSLALALRTNAVRSLSPIQRAINILKSAGPGAWYDPSDLTQAKATWRRNLLTYSESFDNAAWTKAGTTVTANAVAAPDGTNTADLIVETAATSPHYFGNEVVLFTAVSGTSYTQTIYAKYHSKTYLQLTFGAVKFGSQYGVFNLSTGAVASQSNGVATITDVGGGWYRCSWTATATAGGLEAGYYGLVNTTGTRLESYLGNVTIGTYVWGAQLELGSSPTAYQKITDYNTEFLAAFPSHALYQDSAGTTPVTAVEQPVGKILDKSGGGNHLIQPTATSRPTLSSRYNLLTKTEQFDDAYWMKTNATVAANAAVAPDGTMTADRAVFTSGGLLYANGVPDAAGIYVFSCYVKSATGSSQTMRIFGNGTLSYSGDLQVTADWTRVSFTFTYSAPTSGFATSSGQPLDIYVWGAQLETVG